MYESILKLATGNDNLHFNVMMKPFPIPYKLIKQQETALNIFAVFVLGIAFSLMPSSIIAFICGEKQANLKHQQLISGMSLGAYWTLNYTFDMLRAIVLVAVAIVLIHVNKLGLQDVWIALVVYPFAIVPFTYASSFLFDKEGTA